MMCIVEKQSLNVLFAFIFVVNTISVYSLWPEIL